MIEQLCSRLETLLFVAQRPLPLKKLSQLTGENERAVEESLASLALKYRPDMGGIVLIQHEGAYELATNPENAPLVQEYTKEEVTGELTRAGLETLTVVAYRGPVSRSEIEQIRGVNCAIVLRNLMMRGFIESLGDAKNGQRYTLSFDFLRHLGVQNVSELPDFDTLHSDERLATMVSEKNTSKQTV